MHSAIITSHITKLRGSKSSGNLLMSLTPPQIVQKLPAQFATVLAHEVRNPLTNINLAIELLKSMVKDEEQLKYLGIIMRSSMRINDLVNNLLKHQEGDEIPVHKYSIHQLLDEVLEMAQDRIRLKNISVRKDYTVRDCKVILNKTNMQTALTNIIINAVDAMQANKGELKLVTKSIKGKLIMHIEDNGIGISKENLENIFKPYFTNKTGGMGLGLSTTLDIILSNHARVDVQSKEGEGTRFTLSFNTMPKPWNELLKPVV